MTLNFLFLPFIGIWDKTHRHFYVNGHRFEKKWQRGYERCIECIYSIRTQASTFKVTNEHNYAAPEEWVFTCAQHRNHKKEREYVKHPCDKYSNPYRLKKL